LNEKKYESIPLILVTETENENGVNDDTYIRIRWSVHTVFYYFWKSKYKIRQTGIDRTWDI